MFAYRSYYLLLLLVRGNLYAVWGARGGMLRARVTVVVCYLFQTFDT